MPVSKKKPALVNVTSLLDEGVWMRVGWMRMGWMRVMAKCTGSTYLIQPSGSSREHACAIWVGTI